MLQKLVSREYITEFVAFSLQMWDYLMQSSHKRSNLKVVVAIKGLQKIVKVKKSTVWHAGMKEQQL